MDDEFELSDSISTMVKVTTELNEEGKIKRNCDFNYEAIASFLIKKYVSGRKPLDFKKLVHAFPQPDLREESREEATQEHNQLKKAAEDLEKSWTDILGKEREVNTGLKSYQENRLNTDFGRCMPKIVSSVLQAVRIIQSKIKSLSVEQSEVGPLDAAGAAHGSTEGRCFELLQTKIKDFLASELTGVTEGDVKRFWDLVKSWGYETARIYGIAMYVSEVSESQIFLFGDIGQDYCHEVDDSIRQGLTSLQEKCCNASSIDVTVYALRKLQSVASILQHPSFRESVRRSHLHDGKFTLLLDKKTKHLELSIDSTYFEAEDPEVKEKLHQEYSDIEAIFSSILDSNDLKIKNYGRTHKIITIPLTM